MNCLLIEMEDENQGLTVITLALPVMILSIN